MKHLLVLEVDSGDTSSESYCGACVMLHISAGSGECFALDERVYYDKARKVHLRRPRCIAAEVEAKRLGRIAGCAKGGAPTAGGRAMSYVSVPRPVLRIDAATKRAVGRDHNAAWKAQQEMCRTLPGPNVVIDRTRPVKGKP